MSLDALRAVADCEMDCLLKVVALAIANQTEKETGKTKAIPIEYIMVLSGMTRSTVYAKLDKLIEAGAVRRASEGKHKRCEYSLHIDWFKSRKAVLHEAGSSDKKTKNLVLNTDWQPTGQSSIRTRTPKSSPQYGLEPDLVLNTDCASPQYGLENSPKTASPPNAPARDHARAPGKIPSGIQKGRGGVDLSLNSSDLIKSSRIAHDPPVPVLTALVEVADREGVPLPRTEIPPPYTPIPQPLPMGPTDHARSPSRPSIGSVTVSTDRACDQINKNVTDTKQTAKIACQLALVGSEVPTPSPGLGQGPNASQGAKETVPVRFPLSGPGSVLHKLALIHQAAGGLLIVPGKKRNPPILTLSTEPDYRLTSMFLTRLSEHNPSDDVLIQIGRMFVEKKVFPFKDSSRNVTNLSYLLSANIWPGVIGEATAIVKRKSKVPVTLPGPDRPKRDDGTPMTDHEIESGLLFEDLSREQWPYWSAKYPPEVKKAPKDANQDER